jgi:signal transduction histidine kinase
MRFFNTVYTLLLIYMVAALLFWGVSLQRQSRIIYDVERRALDHEVDSKMYPEVYAGKLAELDEHLEGRRHQYLGEGITLMLILFGGAAVVLTSLRRNVALQRQQNNFMLAVTHELKSPIAGMKLSLQTLERRKLTDEQKAQLLHRCIQESDRLADLANNMLLTSQIEGRQYRAAREPVDLTQLVIENSDTFKGRYPGRVITDIDDDCVVVGDVLMLQMALNNLLENAIKYTPAASPIHVNLKCSKKDEAMLQVIDEGGGIPDNEKKKVLTKFYRVGDEATRKTKGTGLGLYLTSKIVAQHKGKLTVKDNDPQGAIFQITLPTT